MDGNKKIKVNMSKQYEMNLKVINELFKKKDIKKNDIKELLSINGKTDNNLLSLIYQLLRELNILNRNNLINHKYLSKNNLINHKYISIYDLNDKDKEILAISLASNLTEYNNERKKFYQNLSFNLYFDYNNDFVNKNMIKTIARLDINIFEFIKVLNNDLYIINDKDREYFDKYLESINEYKLDLIDIINRSIEDCNYFEIYNNTIHFIDRFLLKERTSLGNQINPNIIKKSVLINGKREDSELTNSGLPYKDYIIDYTLKHTLIEILQKDLEYISYKEIKKYCEYILNTLETEKEEIKKTSINSIVSIIIKVLSILGFIDKEKVFVERLNDYRYKVIEIESKEYKISLASKISTISNILPSISSFKHKDATLSEEDIVAINKILLMD